MGITKRDVSSLAKSGSAKLKGDVTLSEGSNITLTQSGQDISIASTGGGGGTVDSVVAGTNIDVDATDPANPIVSVETLTLADISDVTASTAEVNVLDGIPATLTATELGYVDGVTSAIQTQLNAKAADADVVHDTGAETIAGVKTFSSDPIIPDEAYGAGWNGSLEPPTKNAVYDKIEAIPALTDGDKGDITVSSSGTVWTLDGKPTGAIVGTSDTQTLSNKTLSRPTIEYGTGDAIVTTGGDELFVFLVAASPVNYLQFGNSSTGNDLAFTAAGTDTDISIDMRMKGAGVLKADGVAVATISDAQTLTNKTLTSPKINENVAVTATATELNILDGATLSTAELNILDGVTATAAEINALDGITATVAELNYTDGVTSAIQTQLDGKQPLDSDLTTIAGLTATTDNVIQSVGSAWASRTPAQLKSTLALAKADVGLGNVDNTSDATKNSASATLTNKTIDGASNTITGITNASLSTTAGEPGAAWQSWTPTLSGRFDNAKWTKASKYVQIGKTVWFHLYLTASTTTPMSGGSGGATFTLPVTAASLGATNRPEVGTGFMTDDNGASYTVSCLWSSTTTGTIYVTNVASTYPTITSVTSTVPFTWTTSDVISIRGFYEAA